MDVISAFKRRRGAYRGRGKLRSTFIGFRSEFKGTLPVRMSGISDFELRCDKLIPCDITTLRQFRRRVQFRSIQRKLFLPSTLEQGYFSPQFFSSKYIP